MPQSFGQQIDGRGWQAGAVVPAAMVSSLEPYLTRPSVPIAPVEPDHWLVVVSQTCDVVQTRLENEPFVEVLHCRPIDRLRPEFQGRKSTRQLDFRPNKDSHPNVVLTAHATRDRHIVPREMFLEHDPADRELSDRAVIHLQQWYALRYARPAWPDAFNDRIDAQAKKALVAALKLVTTDDVEVRIAIAENDVELEPASPYHVTVLFVVDQIEWISSPNTRAEAHAAFAAFVSVLANCGGIEVNQEFSRVVSGDDFSWQSTRSTDEWNFANLSDHE